MCCALSPQREHRLALCGGQLLSGAFDARRPKARTKIGVASMHRHHRAATIWLLPPPRALRPGAGMTATYQRLAERCVALRDIKKRQVWIGITGGPGAGKSTVAEAVRIFARRTRSCSCWPCRWTASTSRKLLPTLDPPDAETLMPLRGAPQTFDAEARLAEADARRTGPVRRVADV